MSEDFEHSVLTEILIIVSQTTFFLLFFFILKHGIVDHQGWMKSREVMQKNIVPLVTVYFAIFTVIAGKINNNILNSI